MTRLEQNDLIITGFIHGLIVSGHSDEARAVARNWEVSRVAYIEREDCNGKFKSTN